MSIADKLKGLVFEEQLPADPTAMKTPRAVPADQPLMPRTIPVPEGVALDQAAAAEMRNRLGQRRKTAAGWDKIQALRAACASLAEFVPDEKQRMRAAVKTQNLDINALIECCTGVLNVLAAEDVKFREQLEAERARSRLLQQKNMAETEDSLRIVRQKVADLTEEIAIGKEAIRAFEDRMNATEAAFASALQDVRYETHAELKQLESLK